MHRNPTPLTPPALRRRTLAPDRFPLPQVCVHFAVKVLGKHNMLLSEFNAQWAGAVPYGMTTSLGMLRSEALIEGAPTGGPCPWPVSPGSPPIPPILPRPHPAVRSLSFAMSAAPMPRRVRHRTWPGCGCRIHVLHTLCF